MLWCAVVWCGVVCVYHVGLANSHEMVCWKPPDGFVVYRVHLRYHKYHII